MDNSKAKPDKTFLLVMQLTVKDGLVHGAVQ
jgi:hypothetical protein